MGPLSARHSFLILSLFLSSLFLLGPGFLGAQTSITSNDGGTAVSGNLYEAVTSVNETTSNASITLDMPGSTSVILDQALPSMNPNMIFYGTPGTDMGISVVGETEAEGALHFNQNLGMDVGVTFSLSNDGTGGAGQLDSSIIASGLSLGGNSVLEVTGGPIINGALGITGDASAGNASMNLGSFTISTDGNLVSLTGGALTSATGGISGNATGGSAGVSLGALTVSGTGDSFVLTGGALVDSGSSTIGGNAAGGAASWNSGNLNLNGIGDSLALSGGELTVSTGGAIQGEANGGNAEVGDGSITLAGSGNSLSLTGGELNCGNGGILLADGTGGSASVNIGGLTLSGTGDSVSVTGGLLDTGSSGAVTGNGSGGAASIFADALTLSGSNNTLTVTGGEFNNLNGTDQGNVLGGSASVSVSALSLSGAGDSLAITGGELTNTTGGAGGTAAGGGAFLTAVNLSLSAGATLSVVGGSVVGTGAEGSASVSIGTLSGAGVVTMDGSGALLQISSGNFSGIIEGNESLQMLTSGFLTLSGANSYSSGTTIALGTINVDTGGALGTGGITNSSNLNYIDNALAGSNTIQNNGTLSFSNNASANNASVTNLGDVYFNNNSNAGSVTLVNGATGLLAFRDGSSAQNATLLNLDGAPATIDFLDQSNAGSSTITNGTDDLLSFQTSSSAGSAVITNRGTMTFSGSSGNPPSTAGSANITTDAGATLLFQGFSTGGTAQLTTNSGGFTDFSGEGGAPVTVGSIAGSGTYDLGSSDVAVGANSLSTTVLGVIMDGGAGGSLTKIGSTTLTLSGNNTYSGGTLISDGTLTVDTGGSLGTGLVTNNSTLRYIDDATAGSVTIANPTGTLVFSQNATADTATIFNNSYMDFIGSSTADNAFITDNLSLGFLFTSTAGSATIITNNGGSLSFSETASGGTARIILNGTGDLDISNETAGTPVTVGSVEGSGNVFLGGNNLADGSNNLSTSLSGIIADGGTDNNSGGSLTKIRTGTLTLSGDNSYTGGTLLMDGNLVAGSAQALGTGSVAVQGGTLSLNGPRTLDIGGDYTQTGGTLQLGLAGIIPGQWDRLNIAGTASLGGTLSLVSYGTLEYHDNTTLTLLASTGVSGTFGTVQDFLGTPVSLVYQSDDVVLDITANAPSFAALALTPNQQAVGGALDSLASNSKDPALINALDAQPDSALPGIYDQISPASLTPIYRIGFTTAQAEAGIVGQRLSQLFGGFSTGSGDLAWNGESPMFAGNLPAPVEAGMAGGQPQRWSGFADGLGNFATITSDGNGPGYQFSTGGVVAGLDYRFSKDWAGGLLLSYNQSSSNQSTGAVNVTGGEVGLFTGIQKGGWHLDALAESGINSYSTQRGLLGQTAKGSTQGQLYSGQLNTGFDWKWEDFKWGPYLSGQYTRVNVNAFNESGSLAPLSFGAQGESYLDSDLGVEASPKWNLNGLTLAPSVKAAWEHLYQGNLDSLDASMGGGGDFTVKGPALGTNAALLAVGLDARFDRGFSAFVAFQGRLGQTNYEERSLTGGVDIGF
jgi:autotransporter-associated beta strand protein